MCADSDFQAEVRSLLKRQFAVVSCRKFTQYIRQSFEEFCLKLGFRVRCMRLLCRAVKHMQYNDGTLVSVGSPIDQVPDPHLLNDILLQHRIYYRINVFIDVFEKEREPVLDCKLQLLEGIRIAEALHLALKLFALSSLDPVDSLPQAIEMRTGPAMSMRPIPTVDRDPMKYA